MKIEEAEDEGGYILYYPDLPGCITAGETIEYARRVWFEAAMESGREIPKSNDLNQYSGSFKLRIPKSLHRRLLKDAKSEGISLNQYCVYLLSKGVN